jgi:hypothetical protein
MAVAAACLLALSACATGPTPYQAQKGPGTTGYSDQELTHNRFRVTFTGNSQTPRETVENYLLLRAAEVTLHADYEYFMFDTRSTKAKTTYLSSFTGWPGWGGYGWYWHSWPYGPYGPRPYAMDSTSHPITRYHAYAEIVLLTAEQAKKEPRAMNAHEVIAHVSPPPPPPPKEAKPARPS